MNVQRNLEDAAETRSQALFNFFKKKAPPKPAFDEIRDVLFGDAPLELWGASQPGFEQARAAQARRDRAATIAALQSVNQTQGLEARQYLQAWHFLRELGVKPDAAQAKEVLGVVLEVHLGAGLDTLAAYADHSARYINQSGKLIVWEADEPQMSTLIDALLEAGQHIAEVIGPSKEPRRGPPPKGHVRLNMLTRSGLHFGEGPFSEFSKDPMAAPTINAGTSLLTALVTRAGQAKS
jgi:hypothetical protein